MFDILIKRCIVRAHSHSPSVSPRSFMLTLSFMLCSAEIVVSILLYIRSVLTVTEKKREESHMEARRKTLCKEWDAEREREGGMNESK